MKNMDFSPEKITLEELIELASHENLILNTAEGKQFIFAELESEAEFEREVASLSQNEEFMKFMEERSKEPGRKYSLEEFRKELEQE